VIFFSFPLPAKNSTLHTDMNFQTIVLICISLLFSTSIAFGQQIPRSTLYKYQQVSFNPAIAGIGNLGNAQIVNRNQFMGLPEGSGPRATWLNVDMPIKQINSGVGVSVNQLGQGFENRLILKANYAYFLDLGGNQLGFGLSAGINSIGWDVKNPVYPGGGTNDNFIDQITAQKNYINPIFGFGTCYRTPQFYTSFAISELNNPKLKLQNKRIDYFNRTYWLAVGYDYKPTNPEWTIKTAALVKSTFVATQLSFDLITEYKSFLMGGITYTSSNDLSPIFGVQFNNGGKLDGLMALISYDIMMSKMNTQSSGNLEFMLSYSFTIGIEKENKTYKSVRFL
jgi:type IX secretion system PorP/SprF family membrane protein